MATDSFFDEQKEQSLVKATIVAKYFYAWAKVIIGAQKRYPKRNSNKIAYIDLFAGPGRYRDGSQSTPLKILEIALEDPDIQERLVTLFNDKDEENARSLARAIQEIPNVKTLKHQPQVDNFEVGDQIVKKFETMSLVPTLFFVDPWGYKGLSLRLVNSVRKDWGCDCIFFFNYNRINMGLNNPFVKEHMDALFGEEKAEILRDQLTKQNPNEREFLIVEELCQSLKSYGSRYTLPFTFKDKKGNRTSHHLIFVSKNILGYEIMKEIMAKESSGGEQGVPSFAYNPADFLPKQSLLFQLSRPLDDLQDILLQKFAGQKLSMIEIYQSHHVDTPYIKSNYKEALKTLEENKKITAVKPKGKNRRKGTFADDVLVTFPAAKD
ncbi:MAG TPA: hypothetical protein DCY12_11250 [Candidatus Atribacteria bacterium]|nr:hypothetical protein [Candidatus Atribacteria bacterium]